MTWYIVGKEGVGWISSILEAITEDSASLIVGTVYSKPRPEVLPLHGAEWFPWLY